MRYLQSFCLCLSSLVFCGSSMAAQLQFRSFQSQTNLSLESGNSPTDWSGTYLGNSSQQTATYRSAKRSILNSLGQEISLGFFLFPSLMVDVGLAQTVFYPRPHERIEDLTPKVGLQLLTNIQDRWMPFLRLGLSHHQMKLLSNRVENRSLPKSLNLTFDEDRFGVRREWTGDPQFWNGDISLGCKLFLVPTTAINLEYRYSHSLQAITLKEQEEGTSSFKEQPAFVSEMQWGAELATQEFSLAVEVEI